MGFDVYAYVLMTNHVHWLIRTGQVTISTIIHTVHGIYARLFNKANQRVGHVFQGRFKAELCTEDSYILSLCRYIHRNPLEAGIVKKLVDYPWSSYLDLCGLRSDEMVKRGFLLGYFSQPSNEGLRILIEEDYDIQQPQKDPFVQPEPEYEANNFSEDRPGLEKLAQAIVETYQIRIADLQGDSRQRDCVEARRQFIKEAVQEHSYRRSEVARYLKKDRSLVTKVMQDIPLRS